MAGIDYTHWFGPHFDVVYVGLHAGVHIDAGVTIGYDTYGLQRYLESGEGFGDRDPAALGQGFYLRGQEAAPGQTLPWRASRARSRPRRGGWAKRLWCGEPRSSRRGRGDEKGEHRRGHPWRTKLRWMPAGSAERSFRQPLPGRRVFSPNSDQVFPRRAGRATLRVEKAANGLASSQMGNLGWDRARLSGDHSVIDSSVAPPASASPL